VVVYGTKKSLKSISFSARISWLRMNGLVAMLVAALSEEVMLLVDLA
jgi:hypothetical protein